MLLFCSNQLCENCDTLCNKKTTKNLKAENIKRYHMKDYTIKF